MNSVKDWKMFKIKKNINGTYQVSYRFGNESAMIKNLPPDFVEGTMKRFITGFVSRYLNHREKSLVARRQYAKLEYVKTLQYRFSEYANNKRDLAKLAAINKVSEDLFLESLPSMSSKYKSWIDSVTCLLAWADGAATKNRYYEKVSD